MKYNFIYLLQAIIIIWVTGLVLSSKTELDKIEKLRGQVTENEMLRKKYPEIYKKLTSETHEER